MERWSSHHRIRHGVFIPLIALMWLAVWAVPAAADVTITMKTNDVERKMYLTKDKLCMRSPDGAMIFDAKKEVLRMVDPNGKSVRDITKAELEAMGAMTVGGGSGEMGEYSKAMEQARKQAMESIKDLPEEERKAAEEMINKQLPPPPPTGQPSRIYEPMNKKEKIAGYNCAGYTIKQDDATIGEVWTTGLDELGVSKKDFAVMGALRKFFQTAIDGMPYLADAMADFNALDPESDGFIGFPIRQIDLEDGDKEVTELVSIDKGRIDGKVFEPGKDSKE